MKFVISVCSTVVHLSHPSSCPGENAAAILRKGVRAPPKIAPNVFSAAKGSHVPKDTGHRKRGSNTGHSSIV